MPAPKKPLTEGQLKSAIRRLNKKIRSLLRWRKTRKKQLAKKQAQHKPHTHQEWMPGARVLRRDGTAWQTDCPPKGVLHTTEGSGDATSVLDAKRAWPHFQVERGGRITQYLPMSTGARALAHPSGTAPTNGAHCFQIEVCGFASQPDWPDKQRTAVRKVMRFIEANGGVERKAHFSFTSPKRLSNTVWLGARGWLGHVHVPGNDHWDPGKIDIERLLK